MDAVIKGATYRHRNCTEIDMHILAIKYLAADYLKLKVVWINQHYPHITYPQPGTIKLKRKDLPNWRHV